MADLQLFSVTVTEEWSAEAEVLVLADDLEAAKLAAEREVDFDFCDAESDGTCSRAHPVPADQLQALDLQRLKRLDLLLAQVPGRVHFDDYSPERFLELLDPEALRRQLLAIREANNGQIPLPLPTGHAAG